MDYFKKLKPTPVFEAFWHFATERQDIFCRRLSGMPGPWTNDEILARYKFTNAYRILDRASQFLLTDVINTSTQKPLDMFFRILLFKIFNKIETWKLLRTDIGDLQYSKNIIADVDASISLALGKGIKVYSAAYIMPTRTATLRAVRKHRNHLQVLKQMMDDEVYERIADAPTMKQAFELIRSYPMIGDFLAYQFITDINYSDISGFTEMEFVVPGPGAKDGIRKCFADTTSMEEADIIRLVCEHQDEEFSKRGLSFQKLGGRSLQLIDCQNLFCEISKYSRVSHPEILGITARTRIKRLFQPQNSLRTVSLPRKWGVSIDDTQIRRTDSGRYLEKCL
jgi:hypothetical protein